MNEANLLTSKLPLLASPQAIASFLEFYPPSPEEFRYLSLEERLHGPFSRINDIFIVGKPQYKTAKLIRDMIYRYYQDRNPSDPSHISGYYKSSHYIESIAGVIDGIAGAGKSQAIAKALGIFPQVITHEQFPHFSGEYHQIVWFSMTVRSVSKKGFARDLAYAWNDVFGRHGLDAPISEYDINTASMDRLIDLFIQSAIRHNLGFIHLDEVNNLFEMKGKAAQQKLAGKNDELNRKILGLLNFGIPVLFSCTPDGTQGLSSREAISQRIGLNHIRFDRFKPDDEYFYHFLKQLMKYQYTDEALELTPEIATLVYRHTAGIPRIVSNCLIAAQKSALEHRKQRMEVSDLASCFSALSPNIRTTIQALHNEDWTRLSEKADMAFMH